MSRPRQDEERCGLLMPAAGTYCYRMPGHRGKCMSREAVRHRRERRKRERDRQRELRRAA